MLPDFRVRQRDYLLEIARALTQELNLEKLLGRILTISVEMLAGQAGLILLRDDQGNLASLGHGRNSPSFPILSGTDSGEHPASKGSGQW